MRKKINFSSFEKKSGNRIFYGEVFCLRLWLVNQSFKHKNLASNNPFQETWTLQFWQKNAYRIICGEMSYFEYWIKKTHIQELNFVYILLTV